MKPELKERILAYNKKVAADSEAAKDMRSIAEGFAQLPPGQLKKVLTEEITAILEKYGVTIQ